LERTLAIFPRLLREALSDIERGTAVAQEQKRDEGCYYSRRYPDDSRVNWLALTDREVHNLVRGMQGPYPHAFTFRGGDKIEIERTTILLDTVRGLPGRVALKRDEGVVVVCSNRGILVEEVRCAGQTRHARDVLKT